MADNTTISEIDKLISTTEKLDSNKISRFAYTQKAYDNNIIESPAAYSIDNENNIDSIENTGLAEDVKNIGFRSQAASITRNSMNHFFGRISMNLNKLVEQVKALLKLYRNDLRTNCRKWSSSVIYEPGDVVFFVKDKNNEPIVTDPVVLFFVRNSYQTGQLTNPPVGLINDTIDPHWIQSGTTSNIITDSVSTKIVYPPVEASGGDIVIPLSEGDAFSFEINSNLSFTFNPAGIPNNTVSQKVIIIRNSGMESIKTTIKDTYYIGGTPSPVNNFLNPEQYGFIYVTVTKTNNSTGIFTSFVPF